MFRISDDTVCVSLVLLKFLGQLSNTAIYFFLHPLHFETVRLHIFQLGNVFFDFTKRLLFGFNSELLC